MATVFSETFDSYSVATQPPTNWSESGSTNTGQWSVQAAPAGMSGNVARSVQLATSTLIGRSFTRQTSGVITVTWKVRAGSNVTAGRRWGELQFRDGAGSAYFAAVGLVDGQVRIVGSSVVFVSSLAVDTVYTLSASLDLASDKITQVVVNGTTFNNGGAGWAFVAAASGFDNLKIEASSPTVVGGQFVYFDAPVVTNTAPTAGTLGAGTVDEYGQVAMAYTAGTGTPTSLKVYRSNDGTTFADVTTSCTTTDNGSGSWTVTDRHPHGPSESITYGGTGYYKVVGVNAIGNGDDSNTVTVAAIDVDIDTIEQSRAAVLSGIMAASGGTVPSSTSGEAYPGYWVLQAARSYYRWGVAQYKTDCLAQFDLIKNSYTLADGLIQPAGFTSDIATELHTRTVVHCAIAARLLRRAGATSDAQTIIDQCDVWGKAFFDALNSGTPTASKTVAGYDAGNATATGFQHAWAATTAYTAGQVVRKSGAGNGRTYRCTTAGTSAGSEPTWPTTNGGTVTDGTVTWTETTFTGGAINHNYANAAGHATTGAVGDRVIPNQWATHALMFALLLSDATSDFYPAGTYRTKAQTLVSDMVGFILALETSAGAIVKVHIGFTIEKRGYDTLYGNLTLEQLACVYKLVPALVSSYLPGFISRGLNFSITNYYGTEPISSVRATTAEPGIDTAQYYDLVYLEAAATVSEVTNPQAKLPWTAAFQLPATDRVGGGYSATGSPSASIDDAHQAEMFEGLAYSTAVLDAVLEPTGIASTEAVGTPELTPPGGPYTISPTGIASTAQVGQPTIAITPGTPTDLEGFVLDDLDLNTSSLYRLEEFVLGPPPKRYEWIANNDIDGADLLRDPSQDNRPWTLKVRLLGSTRDEVQAAHDAIVAKLEKAERNGKDGITAVWTPVDSSTSYDVIVLSGETTDFPITVESGYFVNAPLITFQGLAKPGLYLPEQTIGPITSSLPLIEIELPDVPGQLPAEATITVGDAATKSRRHVTWGLEQRYYDSATPAPLVLDADDMTTSGYAGSLTTRAGSYGANVVRVTDLPTNRWTAVAGLTSQPHVGVFRVPVRGHGDSSTSLRISWRAGDGPFTAYPAITVPVDGWFEIDLGAVVIPPAPIGAQTWDCRIEAMSAAIGSDLDLDFASLIPAGEGFGRARAVAGNDAAGVVNGFDDFGSGVDGDPLNGEAADGGGTWATAGATGDFQYSDGLPTADLAAARGTSVVEGSPRIMVLGSTSYTDTQAQIARATTPGGISWGGKPGGVIARYVDASNYVYAKRTPSGPFQLGYVLAGTPVSLASATHAPPASGALEAIILLIYASGRAIARLVDAYGNEQLHLEASSSVLATGGALASGKPGIFDQSTDTAAVNRFYDGFTHSVPAPEIVALNADRTLAFRHDTVRRENATGTAYGEPGMYRGGPAYVPPSGDDNLPSRVVIVARRNDIDESTSDDVTDATEVTITLRPRNLWPS